MHLSGAISLDQLAAAASIALVHAAITRDVTIRTASLETRVDVSPRFDGSLFEKLGAVRAEVAYSRWRREAAAAHWVLALAVEELSLNQAAARFGRDKRTVAAGIRRALDLWIELVGEAVKRIDAVDLRIAQARILP